VKLPSCQYKYPCDVPTETKFCIFHDKDHYAKHEQEVKERFEEKVKKSISHNKPLECRGYYIPAINFTKLLEGKSFAQPVYFDEATFYKAASFRAATFLGRASFRAATFSERAEFWGAKFSDLANFHGAKFSHLADFLGATFSIAGFEEAIFSVGAMFAGATFSGRADFDRATFSGGANFNGATFSEMAEFSGATFSRGPDVTREKFLDRASFFYHKTTYFNNTVFEQPNKVTFDNSDLSNVSFAGSDITRIRFGDKITWRGKDGFTIIEEEWLKHQAQEKKGAQSGEVLEDVSLELVLSVYRNLRENYEFRLRYDDAGKFFIKEMELKRKYREIKSENLTSQIKENGWLRRHFSLTGLYYHLSRYGESISRPAAIGAIILFLSTLFWLTQSNPILEPNSTNSTFVGFSKTGEPGQWLKAFERSFADFLPLLPAGDFKVGIIDFIIKIVGGALTFGLLLIAFRRKFERKYTR
jgi:uncharacterized protein YjbI with pentapeptide repeats